MIGAGYTPYTGYERTVATLNRLAGLNKDSIKAWLRMIEIRDQGEEEAVSDDFIEQVASLVIASPLMMAKAILREYYNICVVVGLNPEKSTVFKRRMITQALPALIFKLQEKAGDLSMRASNAKHQDDDIKSADWGI